MKKMIGMLVGLMLLCALHIAALGEETYPNTVDDGHWHWAYCTQPDKCVACGATIKGMWIDHENTVIHHNEKECWEICSDCGEEVYRDVHHAWCTDPDTCYACGKNESDGIVIAYTVHVGYDTTYYYNETECWWICGGCGEESSHISHAASCTDPDTCWRCGNNTSDGIVIGYTTHAGSGTYYNNESECWQVCVDCGEKVYRYKHRASCVDPNTCYICGKSTSEGISISYVDHYDTVIDNNDTECWEICLDCGEELWRSEHVAACVNPGVCWYCGAPFDGEIAHVVNDLDDYKPYDSTYHQFECVYGHGLILEKHDMQDGICRLCGYEESISRTPGDVTGDGKVNLSDVVRLLKYVSGWDVEIAEENCDVTGDGKITLSDVVRLLKYVSNWDVTLE